MLDAIVIPVFTEDVDRVAYTTNMNETKDTRCNPAPSLVVCQRIVTFVEFGIGNGSCIDNQFVASKHNGRRSIGTPRYRKVFQMSMICSVHVLAAMSSEPKVAVSTVDCNFVQVHLPPK